MKMFSKLSQLNCQPLQRIRFLCVLVCGAAVFAVGCHKQDQTSEAQPPATQTPVQTDTSQPAPAAPAPAVNQTTPAAVTVTNAGPDLRPLNQALLSWIVANRRHPASFEEFASSAGIQIPPPPPGKKYVINNRGLISLVNR